MLPRLTFNTPHVRPLLYLLAVAAMCLPDVSSSILRAEDPSQAVRVMSFNIRFGTASDGQNHWDLRHSLVDEAIRRFDPDLLGTQETIRFQADYLKQQLPHLTYVGWSRDANKNGEQCGVMFRTERFELLDSGQFWLSETPDSKFSKSWDSSLPRVATWVRLRERRSNSQLVFLNTHFDHKGQVARRESAGVIRRFVEDLPDSLPLIVTGDFNCGEDSKPYAHLVASDRLNDTFRLAHPQRGTEEGTFNGFAGVATGARIDWILASPHWNVQSASIDRFVQEGRYPSDHFPVTAVLSRPSTGKSTKSADGP